MSNSKKSENPVGNLHYITLMNGREMAVSLKQEQPKAIKADDFMLDTTGEYLTIGNKPRFIPDVEISERADDSFHRRLFIENAWWLYDHSDEIIGDGKLFFAPVKIHNNLAYIGTNGFKNPTIGVYVEWWRQFGEKSIDKEGNLIYYICGSPLSGANACLTVNKDGDVVDMDARTRFMDVWQSFREVNTYYTEAKQRCEAYSLAEALTLLRGKEYRKYIEVVCQELVDYTIVYNNEFPTYDRAVKSSRRTRMQVLNKEIASFYKIFRQREWEMYDAKNRGDVNKYRAMLHELADFATDFMQTTFGQNNLRISLNEVVKFAKDIVGACH